MIVSRNGAGLFTFTYNVTGPSCTAKMVLGVNRALQIKIQEGRGVKIKRFCGRKDTKMRKRWFAFLGFEFVSTQVFFCVQFQLSSNLCTMGLIENCLIVVPRYASRLKLPRTIAELMKGQVYPVVHSLCRVFNVCAYRPDTQHNPPDRLMNEGGKSGAAHVLDSMENGE